MLLYKLKKSNMNKSVENMNKSVENKTEGKGGGKGEGTECKRDSSMDWLREEGLEPLYLDATECRAAGVVTAQRIQIVDQVRQQT